MSPHNKIVIPFPVGGWTFFSVIENGEDVIDAWYVNQSFDAQQQFNKLLKANVKIESHANWLGMRHRMKRDKKDLVMGKVFELEFYADGRNYRVMCIFDGAKRMVMLCGCYHKSDNWTPAGALEATRRRAAKVIEGRANLSVRKIRTDF